MCTDKTELRRDTHFCPMFVSFSIGWKCLSPLGVHCPKSDIVSYLNTPGKDETSHMMCKWVLLVKSGLLSWYCLYLKQVTLNPPPVSMTDIQWGCADIWMFHNCSDTHTLEGIAGSYLHIQTHTVHMQHTQHDNGRDICMYVKLAGLFPAGQDPIIPAHWAERQPVSHSVWQQRWQKRIPDPGAFISPSIYPSFPLSAALTFPQTAAEPCMHAYTCSNFMGPLSSHEEWPPPIYTPASSRPPGCPFLMAMGWPAVCPPILHPSNLQFNNFSSSFARFVLPWPRFQQSAGTLLHRPERGLTHISQLIPHNIGISFLALSLSLYCP